jgi:dTMP kinase
MHGRFITFEGGEGSGKSTQAAMLADRLKSLGIDVLLTREPGGSPGAEIMRHVILSGAAKPLGAEAEAILFAAARDDHVRTVIRPALKRGAWVLCDRFADSTRVYQGVAGKVDKRMIQALERIAVGETRPDLTFVLDLPVEVGLARAGERRGQAVADRFEGEGREFHEKLRAAFIALAAAEAGRCVVVNVTGPRHEVAEKIWHEVDNRLHPSPEAPALREATP